MQKDIISTKKELDYNNFQVQLEKLIPARHVQILVQRFVTWTNGSNWMTMVLKSDTSSPSSTAVPQVSSEIRKPYELCALLCSTYLLRKTTVNDFCEPN
jgi:hypothetical protein